MNQLEYVPGIGGASVQMDGPSSFVGIAEEMRSREWDYDLGYRDLVTATRPARTVDVTFHADYDTADTLRRVADADVMARTPGTFVAQKEWKQRGYILASDVDDIHYGRLSTGLKIALLDGAWWRLVDKNFMPEDTTPTYRSATGKSVTTDGAASVPLHALAVDGESVQDGTPTPSEPVDVQVVGPVNGTFGISINGVVTSIDLQGNVLASLPDGTKDELTVDSSGHVVLTKRVGKLVLAVSDMNNSDSWPGWQNCGARAIVGAGLNAAIPANEIYCNVKSGNGVFSLNSLGQSDLGLMPLATYGLTQTQWKTNYPNMKIELLLKYVTPQTVDLGYIDMPNVFDGAVVSITAEVTPTITAEWQTSPDLYLDYPHNYPHDYKKTSSTESITPSVLTPSDVRLVIYGPAVNPYVIVGDNRYQVNTTVPSGGYLVVDGRYKTINLTLADGTVQNVFSSGVRGGGAGGGSYIFEQIPAGESEVTYDGSFGFDLGWYEEEGEPPWNQS